ncbi:MAG: exodeoxyribonuclease VII large subunit [Chthoniobacterales bacterium]
MKKPPSPSENSDGELNLWGKSSVAPVTQPSATPPAPPVASETKIFRVGELTRVIRTLLEENVGSIWVEGEISNLRKQSSGHQYFTLKDETSQLSCVLFKSKTGGGTPELADGMHVEVAGEVTVYEARGNYQLIVRKVSARGAGALQAKFEALKTRLQGEGLFEAERKRPIPPYALRIGLVTSPTGAALRDFLRVIQTRLSAEIIISPVRVQGTGAAKEISAAIDSFSSEPELQVDVIALIRGGGSLEDLWEFNEEIVARAIVRSSVPVITGVGHEIDFTIADFAADLRAATPSAAAATLLPEKAVLIHRLSQHFARLKQATTGEHDILRSRLKNLAGSGVFREPARRIREMSQRMDDFMERMNRNILQKIGMHRAHLGGSLKVLRGKRPEQMLSLHRHQIAAWFHRLQSRSEQEIKTQKAKVEKWEAILKAFSPQATLERGFTMTTDEQGNSITSADTAKKQSELTTIFHDGNIRSKPIA